MMCFLYIYIHIYIYTYINIYIYIYIYIYISDALTNWAIRPWVQLALRTNSDSYSNFISLFSVHASCWSLPSSMKSLTGNHVSGRINSYIWYRTNYRKLAWVGFEPMTTEFQSDAQTDWTIRPWAQLNLRANFDSYSNFISLFSVRVSFWSLPLSVATFVLSEVSHR